MTNFSPDVPQWQQRFSRERVLVGAPVMAAMVVVSLVALVDGWPRFGRLQVQQQRLEELRRKQVSLPGLQRQLVQAKLRAAEATQQQALLVDLIAGRERIQTFLAQLSREAAATGVVIELYEPVAAKEAPAVASNRNARNSRSNSRNAKAVAPKDPLTSLGYTKTSVLLQAKGSYQALQTFLQYLESLQLLVQPSDLALQSADTAKASPTPLAGAPVPLTQLKLRLNFFDRTAAVSKD